MSPSPAARHRALLPLLVLRLLSAGAALVLGWGATVAVPRSASAHSVLVSSDPADGASLDAMPADVTLTFNEAIDPHFAQVIVNSGGIARKSTGVTVDGAKVTATVPQDVTPGQVTVLYRVTSADSHPVEGKVTFTVGGATASASPAPGATSGASAPAAPGATSAAPGGTEDHSAHQGHEAGSTDMGNAMMIALTGVAAVVLVVVGVLLLRSERRRR